jgi:pimeloyl-ACP methyl ester carboxylesterase
MRWRLLLVLVVSGGAVLADGPGDNLPDKVRPVPPPGVAVPADVRADLQAGCDALGREIADLSTALKARPRLLELLPDVQIYHNAVRYALAYNEFYGDKEFAVARGLLKQGAERAAALRDGTAPWATATGLVVRGYRSRIDGSVQPYGLVVPASYRPDTPHRHRLDFWFHGRDERLTELRFLDARQRSAGDFTPPNAFVLHLYGRYCNANKFAGEIDLFEALADVRKHYPIDENRLVVRGFSMGGAACWQFAVHYGGRWAAAAPGAGFSETPHFLKVFQRESIKPTWYEEKLWHWYDCTDYAVNLANCPVVAYSGELDSQKQAADMMAKAMAAEGLSLQHILGPNTKHAYHPQAKEEINRRIDALAARGRDPLPRHVRFTTWTLRYNQLAWVTVDGLGQHWERAGVEAEVLDAHTVKVTTQNVTALTLAMPPGLCPLDPVGRPKVLLDGRELEAAPGQSDRSWTARFRKADRRWVPVSSGDDGGLRKRHGLQGPIDDAFLDSFVMVRPTGKPLNEKIGAWAAAEMAHAVDHWRRQFRGEARVVDDTELDEADVARSNLVLWGDPASNRVLARVVGKLPIRWDGGGVVVGDKRYDAGHHVPVLIYPNPLNPRRYVVLDSGFTFREYDYLNNARQVAKLPDWAVVDVNVPRTSRAPGGIVAAGFFDEEWKPMPDTH